MRGKKVDHFLDAEAGIGEAVENHVGRVGRFGDEEIGRGQSHIRAASEELEAWAASAV